jgi:ACS family hexuronate transporter-like MFS transporter
MHIALSSGRRWGLIALLALAGILNTADRQMIAVLKPLMQRDLRWSDDTYGTVVSAFQLATALAYVGAGWLVDRIGLRWVNPLGVGAYSLLSALHGVARSTTEFVIVRFSLGAAASIGTPAAIKAIAVWFEAGQRGLALGLVNAATNLGAVATPLLVPAIALIWGWRAAFVLLGAFGFAWVVAWVALYPGSTTGDRGSVAGRPAFAGSGLWRESLRDRRTWAVVGAKALADSVWWLLLFWLPDLLGRTFHLDVSEVGAPVAIVYLAAIAGSLSGGFASSRLIAGGMHVVAARERVLLACALLATSLLFVLHARSLGAVVALLSLGVAAHQGFSVNLFSLITDIVPSARVGTVTSIGALAGNLAGMAEIWLLGQHLSRGGGYAPFLGFSGVAFLLASAWFHAMLPRWPAAQESHDDEPETPR